MKNFLFCQKPDTHAYTFTWRRSTLTTILAEQSYVRVYSRLKTLCVFKYIYICDTHRNIAKERERQRREHTVNAKYFKNSLLVFEIAFNVCGSQCVYRIVCTIVHIKLKEKYNNNNNTLFYSCRAYILCWNAIFWIDFKPFCCFFIRF